MSRSCGADGGWTTINTEMFQQRAMFTTPSVPVDFTAEETHERIRRRKAQWTPKKLLRGRIVGLQVASCLSEPLERAAGLAMRTCFVLERGAQEESSVAPGSSIKSDRQISDEQKI